MVEFCPVQSHGYLHAQVPSIQVADNQTQVHKEKNYNNNNKKKHKQLNIASEINADREGDFGVSTQSDGDESSSGLFYKAQLRDAPVLHWYL